MNRFIPSLADKVLLAALVAMVLLGPTQYSFEAAPRTYVSAVDPIVWLAFASLLVSRFRPPFGELVRAIPLTGFLFLVLATLSLFHAQHLFKGLKDVFQYGEYFIAAYLVFAVTFRNPRLLRVALLSAVTVTTLVLGLALFQYLSPAIDGFHVAGPFGNRNVLGGFLSLAVPLLAGGLVFGSSPLLRAWCLLCILVACTVLLSGGAAAGIAVAFLLVAGLRSGRTVALTAVAVVVVALFVLPFLPRANRTVLAQSSALYDADGAPTPRYTEWQAALFMVQDNPMLGVGAGNYQDHIGMYYGYLPSPEHAAEPDSQNLHLVLASSCGLPAALMFIAFLAEMIGGALRRFGSEADPLRRGLLAGAAGGLVAFAIACIWSPLLVRGIGIPLAFVFALITATPVHQVPEEK